MSSKSATCKQFETEKIRVIKRRKRRWWAKKKEKSLFAVIRPTLEKSADFHFFIQIRTKKNKKSADRPMIFHYFLQFFLGKTN